MWLTFPLVVGAQLVRVGTIVVPIGLSLVALLLVVLVVVVVQLLFLGRTVVLGSPWRGEVVLNAVSRVYIGSRVSPAYSCMIC